MPVRKELWLEKGWKESENNRFGYCIVIRYVNVEDNKILYREALKIEDKDFYAQAFNTIFVIDEMHKEYLNKIRLLPVKFSEAVNVECGFVNAKDLNN